MNILRVQANMIWRVAFATSGVDAFFSFKLTTWPHSTLMHIILQDEEQEFIYSKKLKKYIYVPPKTNQDVVTTNAVAPSVMLELVTTKVTATNTAGMATVIWRPFENGLYLPWLVE